MLYPLKFTPVYKTPVWGGENISKLPGRRSVPAHCGESWEISTVSGSVSVVAGGTLKGNTLEELIEIYMGDLVGEKVYADFGLQFPLLVKIIDAASDLSVQVHPDDEYAFREHNNQGKTEMWYVMRAGKEAGIINGFSRETNAGEVMKLIQDDQITQILNRVPAEEGDVHFIPSGRVHAIGAGIMLAEIQQSSDITYRLYDWGRKDDTGISRPLHISPALEVLDFSASHSLLKPDIIKNKPVNIAMCDYFTVNLLPLSKPIQRDYSQLDSFVILMNTAGDCHLKSGNLAPIPLKCGETILIPACLPLLEIIPADECKLLECYIE